VPPPIVEDPTMLALRSTLNLFNLSSVRALKDVTGVADASVTRQANRALIMRHYQANNGRNGPLGFPTSAVEVRGPLTVRQYRGGEIQVLGGVPTGSIRHEASVTFLGFTCVQESDHDQLSDTDEPYFVISVDSGNGIPITKKFGPFENTETGRRLGIGEKLIQNAAPNPLGIRVQAYENDEGDPDETAKELQEKLVELSKEAASLASASGAEAADGPGVGPAAAAGGVLAGPLGALLAVGVVKGLGLGDDFIGQGMTLAFQRPESVKTPDEMGKFEGVPFNAKIDIDGGGEGKYELFFDIHVAEIDIKTK
jgi:hypothetical protein